MKVTIETIAHDKQRYETCGDYYQYPNKEWIIRVSKTGDDRYDFLIALHEFIELYLTQFKNITEESIMNFDLEFERRREIGEVDGEPGFNSCAPYRKQHTIATAIEMMLAAELDVDWNEYDKKINEM